MIYREFEIEEYWLAYANVQVSHRDYDGPGDPRCWFAESYDEAKQQVDEWWEDHDGAG